MKNILRDWFEGDVRVIIKRNPSLETFMAYVGVPSEHPFARRDLDDILNCHGGLTVARGGDDVYLPKGYYWYGWDYSHAGDYIPSFEKYLPTISKLNNTFNTKKWTLDEVVQEATDVAWQLRTALFR